MVVGCWAVLALAVPLAVPSLTEMAERNPIAILPADAPSTIATREMTEAFKEAGSENVLVVLLTDDNGLRKSDEQVYGTLVDRLRQDNADVVMLQDFLSTPELRQVLASQDGKAWILPVGLAGELGTPESYGAFTRVSDIVDYAVAGTSLKANLTGPAATVADLTAAGAKDRLPIELAIAVLLLLILAVIYRNPATMMLPLITIGASLLTAQGVVAAISLFTGMAISNQTIVFLSAMIAGAGTDYAVFLISRYHDYVRQGSGSVHDSDLAVQRGLVSIGRVIVASAATVGVTFLGMGFAKLGVFSTVGVALAVGIGVAFLAAVTLLPAVLVLAGRRGWVAPRSELTAGFWRRSGTRIVRRPAAYLAASLVILIALASYTGLVRFNYDDRKQLPETVESSVGYAALERHFPVNQTIPEYLLIKSPQDLRTPRALADLEQMAQRVSQLPGIALIRGVTRPTGESLEQARATYQAGEVGNQLGGASNLINGSTGDLNQLASGADQMADGLRDARGQINQAIGNVRSLIDAFATIQGQFGGDTTLGQFGDADKLVKSMRSLGDLQQRIFGNLSADFSWLDPVVASLDASPVCNASPVCIAARGQFYVLKAARDDGTLDRMVVLARQLQNAGPLDKLSTTVDGPQPDAAVGVRLSAQAGVDGCPKCPVAVHHGAEACERSGRRQPSDCRWSGIARRSDQADGSRPRPGVGLPDGHGGERNGPVNGGLQHPGPGARHRRLQEDGPTLHLAGRTLGAVLHPDRPQPLQHRGDGSGEVDPRYRQGRTTEHHAGGRIDLDIRIPRHPARHPGLLRPGHPPHRDRDRHRRATDPHAVAARGRGVRSISSGR